MSSATVECWDQEDEGFKHGWDFLCKGARFVWHGFLMDAIWSNRQKNKFKLLPIVWESNKLRNLVQYFISLQWNDDCFECFLTAVLRTPNTLSRLFAFSAPNNNRIIYQGKISSLLLKSLQISLLTLSHQSPPCCFAHKLMGFHQKNAPNYNDSIWFLTQHFQTVSVLSKYFATL